MTSVNYNASATAALRTLQETNSQLSAVQNRVSTGYKIGEAKDNAAYWSISTTLKSDNKSLATVKDALGLGAATVDVAYEGLNSAKDVLDEIKSKLTAATQDGVDRSKIQSEIEELQKQLKSIADSSIFSGENWLSVDSSSTTYNATKSVVASFSRDAQGAVSVGTINVDTSTVKLFDASASATGIIDNAVTLKKADGTLLTVGGTNASGAVPALQGLNSAASTAGIAAGSAEKATVTLGTFNIAGLDTTDKINFNLSVDGGPSTSVSVATAGITNADTLRDNINAAFTATFGAGKVAAINTGGVITIESTTQGANSALTLTGLVGVDGDGDPTSALGMAPAIADFSAATRPAATTFTFAGTSDAGDTVRFRFQYNGETYDSSLITLGAAETDATYTTKLQTALNGATKVSDGTAIAANAVLATTNGTAISLQAAGAGADFNFGVISVTTNDVDGDGTAAADINLGLAASAVAFGADDPASVALGTFDATNYDAGDRVRFDVTLYNSNGSGGSVADKKTMTVAAAATVAEWRTNLQAAFDAAYGAGKVTIGGGGSAVTATTVAGQTGTGLAFDNFVGLDGNGAVTSTLGMTTTTLTDAGKDLTTNVAAFATSGSAFVGPAVFDAQDELTFNVAIDGGAATKVTVNKATIDAALGGAAGTIANATEFATVVNKALQNASLNTVLTASADGSNRLVLTKNTAGAGSVTVSGAASTTGGDTMSIDQINVTDTALSALGVTSADRKDVLTAYISVVNEAINKITSAAATLGSVSSRIELQQGFVNKLMDTIDKGVSGLVDADMSEESTKLQALQTKQQLGVQALSIANSSAQNILSLFR